MDDPQLLRYARHILLDDFGVEGQERLLAARVLIVGAGGLGSPAACYLAASGVGHIVLADDDRVELSNLQRQILHTTERVGQAKAESGRMMLAELNPEIRVTARVARLEDARLSAEVAQADVVLDCSDNFATRHAINRACVAEHTPLVAGAAIRYAGQVAVFDRRDTDDTGAPCYHCVFAEDAADMAEESCATTGVFAPLVGIIGSVQAAEALKILTGIGQTLSGRLLQLDARTMRWRESRVTRDAACPVCSGCSAHRH